MEGAPAKCVSLQESKGGGRMQVEQVFLLPAAVWTDVLNSLFATGITLLLLPYGRNLQFSFLRLQEWVKSGGGSVRTRVRQGRHWPLAPPNSVITIYNILM